MRNRALWVALITLSVITSPVLAQDNPMVNQRWNTFEINKISTKFNNTGLLCDGNQQNAPLRRDPAMEYPSGSGLNWGTSVGFVVGAPFPQLDGAWGGTNPNDYPFLDGTMDEGSADFWNEEHFAPYAGFSSNEMAAMSNNPQSWPSSWPGTYPESAQPLLIGSEGWPGFGAGGERVADVESFAVMYGWGGTDQLEGGGSGETRWLNTQMTIRGLAFTGSLYEDFLLWVVVIRNVGTDSITDMRAGVHIDLGYLPEAWAPSSSDADRHYWNGDLQLAYSTDDNGYVESPFGGSLGEEEIPWGGVAALRMPGGDHTVATYDAAHFWQGQTSASGSGGAPEMYWNFNLTNTNDPHDSNGDGIDDDFDEDGVPDVDNGGPNFYVGSSADGLQVIGSNPFTLQPGETDTMIIAVIMGTSQEDLFTNTERAVNLYENDFEPLVAPPTPKVESKVSDREVTLYWDTAAEQDVEFEGYKVYRSADNGTSWGSRSFRDFQGSIHYIPLAQYDLPNNLTGNYRTLPEYAWFDLGSDDWSQLRRPVTAEDELDLFTIGDTVNVFTDRDVINGINYLYYVAAYDSGNAVVGPLESTPATDPSAENNTVSVVPNEAYTTGSDLSLVRVVPNPYVVSNAFEQSTKREVQFVGLPDQATIHIYNVSGERVQSIEHTASSSIAPSIEAWDLLNSEQQLVAPGVYFYYIESPLGEAEGKFVLIL